jgi:hypothetical protein
MSVLSYKTIEKGKKMMKTNLQIEKKVFETSSNQYISNLKEQILKTDDPIKLAILSDQLQGAEHILHLYSISLGKVC